MMCIMLVYRGAEIAFLNAVLSEGSSNGRMLFDAAGAV